MEGYKILQSKRHGYILVQKDVPISWFKQASELTETTSNIGLQQITHIAYLDSTDKPVCLKSLPKKDRASLKQLNNTYKNVLEQSAKYIQNRLNKKSKSLDEMLNEGVSSNKFRNRERSFLEQNINEYLHKLNLPTIQNSCLDGDQLYVFSTIGDSLLKVKCLESTYNNVTSSYLLSNINMKLAMFKLGWSEFFEIDHHLCGTVFETLYYIAFLHKNNEALQRLEHAVFGDMCDNIGQNVTNLLDMFDRPIPVNHTVPEEIELKQNSKTQVVQQVSNPPYMFVNEKKQIQTSPTRTSKGHPFDEDEFIILVDCLLKDGMPTQEIADAIGISHTYLLSLYKKQHIPKTTRTAILTTLNNLVVVLHLNKDEKECS